MKNVSREAKLKAIEYLESLAEKLDSVTVRKQDFLPYDENTLMSLNTGKNIIIDEEKDDDEPVVKAANPFTTKPLFWGNESLAHEDVVHIKEANLSRLNPLQQELYAQRAASCGLHPRASFSIRRVSGIFLPISTQENIPSS